MADDTAALVLSLEARFDKFEKAMTDAAKVVDRSTKQIENSFQQMTGVIADKLAGVQQGLVGRLGLAGQLLTRLGPAGIAAAVGIGAAGIALKEAADQALAFGEKMKKLRDLAATTGLTTDALQALKRAAVEIGADFDNVTPAIDKFVRNWELLKQGSGELRTQLLRINPALEAQLATAKDETEAVQILAKAFQGLSASQAQLLGRAAFGRADQDAIRLFIKGFDLDALQAKLRQTGKLIPTDEVNQTAEAFDKLKASMKGISDASVNLIGRPLAPFLETVNGWLKSIKDYLDSITLKMREFSGQQEDISKLPRISVTGPRVEAAPPPRQIPIGEQATQSREAIAFLGAAATQAEKYKDSLLQLRAEVEKNGNLQQFLARAIKEADRANQQAIISAKERLGVASLQEIQTNANIDIERTASQFRLSSDEKERASLIAKKEALEKYNAELVRASNFPGLTKMGQDFADLNKQLDQLGTQSINTFVDSMADAVTGAKSLQDAFRDMTNSILKDIARLVIRQAIVSPLLGAIGLTGKMAGGPVAGGTPYIVGERGPELFIPNQSGTVVPNNKLGSISIGGPRTTVNVQGGADSSTVTMMRAMLAERDRRFVADVARATGELKRRSVFA